VEIYMSGVVIGRVVTQVTARPILLAQIVVNGRSSEEVAGQVLQAIAELQAAVIVARQAVIILLASE
jgi:hypothetical protein